MMMVLGCRPLSKISDRPCTDCYSFPGAPQPTSLDTQNDGDIRRYDLIEVVQDRICSSAACRELLDAIIK